MSVEKGVFELIKTKAGGRIYALTAPQNATVPFVVFQRVSGDRWRSVNAPSGISQVTIQIDCYALDYYGAKDLAVEIETILDGHRGTVYYGSGSPQDSVRIAGISLDSESDLLDQDEEPFLYRVSTRYLTTYEV